MGTTKGVIELNALVDGRTRAGRPINVELRDEQTVVAHRFWRDHHRYLQGKKNLPCSRKEVKG
jgi:hypothetical protein